MIEGRGLLVDGQRASQGFYTTRFVEADNQSLAKVYALELVRKELRSLRISVDDGGSHTFKLYVDEVTRVSTFEDYLVPGKGFTFYDEDQPEIEEGGVWRGLIGFFWQKKRE